MSEVDYGTMLADGWDYHRNGGSGCGFYVRTTKTALQLRFGNWEGENEIFDPPITVPLEIIVQAIAPEPATKGIRSAVADRIGIVAFDHAPLLTPGIAIVDLQRLDDTCIAVFDAELLLNDEVRFFHNSWRGDHFYDMALAALGITSPRQADVRSRIRAS